MRAKSIFAGIAPLIMFGLFFGLAFLGGFIVGKGISPGQFYDAIHARIVGRDSSGDEGTEGQIETIFLQLEQDSGVVPVERRGDGGGLTSFGDSVLLLTHEGRIFAARSGSDIIELPVAAPDNGLAGYRRVSQTEAYSEYIHQFDKFRYNDILHYRDDNQQGLVISYTEFDEARECYVTALAHLALDPAIELAADLVAAADDWDVVFRTEPCLPLKEQARAIEGHMAGGRIAFSTPSTIYLASGEYHWDGVVAPASVAQDPETHYGKVIAFDLATRSARVLSMGHRNTQGIAIDATGRLWVVEHGMRGGDELNLVTEGADFGWPVNTLGTAYSLLPFPGVRSYGRHTDFTAPIFAWLPSVAPSNLTLIDRFHPTWDGDLLMSSLRAQSLYRIRVRGERVLFAEHIAVGHRIRYVHQHGDGRLVLWTDDKRLIFLRPDTETFIARFVQSFIEHRTDWTDAQRNQFEATLGSCMECHSFEPGADSNSPGLASIFGAPIGETGYDYYTDALANLDGRWDRDNLRNYFADPQAFAPGTSMPDPGLDDGFALETLLDFLEASAATADR